MQAARQAREQQAIEPPGEERVHRGKAGAFYFLRRNRAAAVKRIAKIMRAAIKGVMAVILSRGVYFLRPRKQDRIAQAAAVERNAQN